MAINNPRHEYERKRSQIKTETMGQKHGRHVVERLANLWIRRNVESSNRYVGKRAADSTQRSNVIPLHAVIPKLPVIVGIRPEKRSKAALDRSQWCWHVSYQFCGLSADIIVHAQNEADAHSKAVDQLRARGLKVVDVTTLNEQSDGSTQ